MTERNALSYLLSANVVYLLTGLLTALKSQVYVYCLQQSIEVVRVI